MFDPGNYVFLAALALILASLGRGLAAYPEWRKRVTDAKEYRIAKRRERRTAIRRR